MKLTNVRHTFNHLNHLPDSIAIYAGYSSPKLRAVAMRSFGKLEHIDSKIRVNIRGQDHEPQVWSVGPTTCPVSATPESPAVL